MFNFWKSYLKVKVIICVCAGADNRRGNPVVPYPLLISIYISSFISLILPFSFNPNPNKRICPPWVCPLKTKPIWWCFWILVNISGLWLTKTVNPLFVQPFNDCSKLSRLYPTSSTPAKKSWLLPLDMIEKSFWRMWTCSSFNNVTSLSLSTSWSLLPHTK